MANYYRDNLSGIPWFAHAPARRPRKSREPAATNIGWFVQYLHAGNRVNQSPSGQQVEDLCAVGRAVGGIQTIAAHCSGPMRANGPAKENIEAAIKQQPKAGEIAVVT